MKHTNIWLKTLLLCLLTSTTISGYRPFIRVISRNIPQTLNKYIRSSQQSIQMAQYYLTHPDTIKALLERRAAHVPVEIIIDQATLKRKPENIAKLLNSGTIIYVYSKTSGLMHHKLSLLDSCVITGSANASQNCSNNEEHILIIYDEQTHTVLKQEFEALKKKCIRLTKNNFDSILK